MTRYLVLNIVVMALLAAIVFVVKLPYKKFFNRRGLIILGAILLMTAVGDNAILALKLVDYNVGHILGVYLGQAPIEDFSYAIVVAVLVPLLWERGAKK